MREKELAKVISQKCIGTGVYSMWIETKAAQTAVAGQFISVYCKDKTKLLPRPISICQIDKKKGRLRIVYRVVGGGTEEMSSYSAGDDISLIGPLGNGFMQREGKKAILIGGGIGIPPMVGLAEALKDKAEVSVVAGYRDELFLTEELENAGKLYIATEDGSTGTKGTVIDAIKEQAVEGDVIYACGPTPMLKAIKEYALANNIECQLSLEERMACGIGACLACVCQSKDKDAHSNVNNKRICKDGPVFLAEEVEL
ncbi:dihydroorotate dehydrogenase electron transfer subunit [uncultured Eubacterium sp.]|uniref:dihydroorotate dehydrogenase electron transfer subunit n=1 Tax=uncultured Eubacterium sp. TaxID=165185 RepID=UPI002634086A|nr:dihydroorotate dehydrogenase electron transfer subunit [uncultured Eubacterium sp.]